ncbi:plasmid mobilization relaxosome protein MobC [Dechloromonas sp. HYN0024]|uniref:plasmid mobilization protein n=1 Tax=Dechloromonas sp. HYN0024 TaxID=2231055 RepID=UPI000E42D6C9|nr:plasmid mobilization relaxosome protein MobC [Dechloromonas sp. HYN0024]AXS79831.1 plasmid mobilization relaxosome protein MobC [Dechloromonas sp. HYN0024]
MPKSRNSVLNSAFTKKIVSVKGGRPSEGRCKPVTVRFTEYEHDQLMQAVHETGMTASDLIRQTAAGIEIKARPAPVTNDLLKELIAWGNNLNQIAYKCNSGGSPIAEISEILTKCYNALARIEQTIQGGASK